jgi:hypothetical protein
MDAVLLDTDVFSFLARAHDRRGDAYRPYVQGKTVAISFIRAFSLLLWTGQDSEVRLFLRKSRVGGGRSVSTRSENAVPWVRFILGPVKRGGVVRL